MNLFLILNFLYLRLQVWNVLFNHYCYFAKVFIGISIVSMMVKKYNKFNSIFYLAGFIIVIIFFVLAVPFEIKEDYTIGEGRTEEKFIHWHALLNIVVEGMALTIPANIGINLNEHAVIHTHEAGNVLHIEQFPNETTMRLGYFFKIWSLHANKSVIFNNTCILDKCNNATHEVKFIVNGDKNNKYENYLLNDGDNITIEYGIRDEILYSQ